MIVHAENGEAARVEELPGRRFRLTITRSDFFDLGDWWESDGLQVRVGHPVVFTGVITGWHNGHARRHDSTIAEGGARVVRIEPLPLVGAPGGDRDA